MQDREAFFKQLNKLTKYKNNSSMPTKVKRNDTLIEEDEYSNIIMTHVLKGVSKDDTLHHTKPDPPLPRIEYSDFELSLIPRKFSYKKAMGPDLIPDAIFAGKNINDKRDMIIKNFLTNSINTYHCRSRLILLNKSKDPIPEIGDLRPRIIMGTMQKLLEISIVHHLKEKMANTSPFQFGFKSGTGTGTGEAIIRLNMKIRQLRRSIGNTVYRF